MLRAAIFNGANNLGEGFLREDRGVGSLGDPEDCFVEELRNGKGVSASVWDNKGRVPIVATNRPLLAIHDLFSQPLRRPPTM